MLAFILLVVLGGGLGLLAVSLAESPKPATDGGSTARAPDPPGDDDPAPAEAVAEAPADAVPDDLPDMAPPALPAPVTEELPEELPEEEVPGEAAPAEPLEPVTASTPAAAATRPTRRRPDARKVPRAYTAVEGRFDTVAVAPLWRRLLSVIALVLIAVAIGVGVAAAAAAVFGALAELLDAAIG